MTSKSMSKTWQKMASAPRNATWVQVKMKDGRVLRAHWASNESGEEQPAYRGWFQDCGSYFRGINNPVAWRPL